MDIRNFFKRPTETEKKASSGEQPKKKAKILPENESKRSTSNLQTSSHSNVIHREGRVEIDASDFFVSSKKSTPKKLKATKASEDGLKQSKDCNFARLDSSNSKGTQKMKINDSTSSEYRSNANESLDLPKTPPTAAGSSDKKRRRVADGESGMESRGSYESAKKSNFIDECIQKDEEKKQGKPSWREERKVIPQKEKPTKNSHSNKKSSIKTEKEPLIQPTLRLDKFDTESSVPECLKGLTFVFTGILKKMDRDSSVDFVKILGGRVTNAVSGRTSYLVVGEELEDGRHYSEGSKYRKAKELNIFIVKDTEELYGLCKLYDDKARAMQAGCVATNPQNTKTNSGRQGSKSVSKVAANPYSNRKSSATNPYEKKKNPYNKTSASNPDASTASTAKLSTNQVSTTVDNTALWADKYAPQHTRDILGNADSVKKLGNWLTKWEATFNNEKSQGKTFSSPNGPWKAALLSGPPGIGKTTTATLVAAENGRDILEMNASDVRSKKALGSNLGDVTGSQVIAFEASATKMKKSFTKRRCLIMDEVDGMGAGDRSGMSELIKMIKGSKVPVICICNDRQSQKIRSLVPYCMDLRYKRPTKSVIARRAIRIGEQEGMKIEQNAAEAISESCGNDIRQVLNVLQMWSNRKEGNKSITYKDLKERESTINKDEILRVSMFDATRIIIEGRRGLASADAKRSKDSLYRRSDAFFVDYSLVGLNVHQNYPKVMAREYQEVARVKDEARMDAFVERMHDATLAMSDFAIGEEALRGGDQNWSLLPFISMMAVKTGYHAGGDNGGFLGGFPEFSGWLGKNSSRGKKQRLLQQMEYHMNYKISSDRVDLRLHYFPLLRERFMELLTSEDEHHVSQAIQLMDKYGLDRLDIFENIDEFYMDKKGKTFGDLDSKQKAKFTREYNKRSHKSQALVHEQGAGKVSKKSKSSKLRDPADLDAVDDDLINESEDEEEDFNDDDIKKIFRGKKAKGKSKANMSNVSGKKRKNK
mmetsp:Transcript_2130/g.3149  ORF Transcript_2130/g.3149 Transcript_2130/m.3149 type:complete len:992 (+) Transcript_2130:99-3074(+)|eukprot:CAMPEP_0194218104 /NCGR_PEP_ID=MMETSP0156-20130528/23027_1 /TAXON_ID=33649 /ORGANISM="Thalassionema nitzschioides, Strain L26-B" /LENGTH=991 /DNA_ID=CAMNT_0038947347 /DNA_START=23 /DNA_END=2998 /DNA_ORIENTATION=+